MKKLCIFLAVMFSLVGSAFATDYTGTAQIPTAGLFGTYSDVGGTTVTLNFNDSYITGTSVLAQTVANSSATTPSTGNITFSDSTTGTISIVPSLVTSDTWAGTIAWTDSQIAGTAIITAVPTTSTPDYSVSSAEVKGSFDGISVTVINWESDDDGDTTGTVILPVGVIRSVRFYPGALTPTDEYDVTLKDADGFDCLVSGGTDVDSDAPATINPVLNTSFPPAVRGSWQLLITNAGADKNGRIEIVVSQ